MGIGMICVGQVCRCLGRAVSGACCRAEEFRGEGVLIVAHEHLVLHRQIFEQQGDVFEGRGLPRGRRRSHYRRA